MTEIFSSPGVYSSEAVSRATSIVLDLAFGKFGNAEGIGGLYLPEIGTTYAEYLTMPYGLPREYLVQAKIRRDKEIATIMRKRRNEDDLVDL